MVIESTTVYNDPETEIFLAIKEDSFEVGAGKDRVEFSVLHSFPLLEQIDYMIDLFTTAKGDLEKLQ